MPDIHLRLLRDTDSFDELTHLLHRAYAPLAAQGLRFLATHQSADVTRARASRGECWVAESEGRLVGTITLKTGPSDGDATFNQMGVLPELKGTGLGRRLLAQAETRARELGKVRLRCDTSVHARELHALYGRHGFRADGFCDWRPHVNYLSVRFAKDLTADLVGPPFVGWDRAPDNAWSDRGPAVRALFDRVWDRMTDRLDLAAELGFPWWEVSTAFLVDDVAHVGVLEIAARIDGRSHAIAGIHAVGTDPVARERGFGRAALTRALRHVDERFATAMLTTLIPDYFAPLGFREIPEHRFRVARPLPTGTGPPLRRLSHRSPADLALVKQVLTERTHTSDRYAVQEEGWFFAIDEILAHSGFGTLWAADDLGAIVAWQRNGDRAQILDIAAPTLPTLAEVAARLPSGLQGIDLLFCPDRFEVETDPIPGSPDGTTLMVRGDWPLAGPVAVPLHARC